MPANCALHDTKSLVIIGGVHVDVEGDLYLFLGVYTELYNGISLMLYSNCNRIQCKGLDTYYCILDV